MSKSKTWVIVKLKWAKKKFLDKTWKSRHCEKIITKLDFTKHKTTYQNNTKKKVKPYIFCIYTFKFSLHIHLLTDN